MNGILQENSSLHFYFLIVLGRVTVYFPSVNS